MTKDSKAVPESDTLDIDGIEAEFDDASLDGVEKATDATGDAPNGGK